MDGVWQSWRRCRPRDCQMYVFEAFQPPRRGDSNGAAGFATTKNSWHTDSGIGRIEPFRLEWFDSHRDERLARFTSGRRKRHHRPPWWRRLMLRKILNFFDSTWTRANGSGARARRARVGACQKFDGACSRRRTGVNFEISHFLRNFGMARSIFRERGLARSVSRALRSNDARTD